MAVSGVSQLSTDQTQTLHSFTTPCVPLVYCACTIRYVVVGSVLQRGKIRALPLPLLESYGEWKAPFLQFFPPPNINPHFLPAGGPSALGPFEQKDDDDSFESDSTGVLLK